MPSPLHELRRLLNQRPFQSFTLFLQNGDRLLVTQPEMVVTSTSLVPAMNMTADGFASYHSKVWIGGADIQAKALEYLGSDGFPIEVPIVPDDATWAVWRRLRSWTKYRRLCKLVIGVSIFAIAFLSPSNTAQKSANSGSAYLMIAG